MRYVADMAHLFRKWAWFCIAVPGGRGEMVNTEALKASAVWLVGSSPTARTSLSRHGKEVCPNRHAPASARDIQSSDSWIARKKPVLGPALGRTRGPGNDDFEKLSALEHRGIAQQRDAEAVLEVGALARRETSGLGTVRLRRNLTFHATERCGLWTART